jgi:hypothetical protein
VLPTLFIVGACTFVQMPARAWMVTVVVTGLLFVASIVATLVCALVFPEYCVDEVRHHLQQVRWLGAVKIAFSVPLHAEDFP